MTESTLADDGPSVKLDKSLDRRDRTNIRRAVTSGIGDTTIEQRAGSRCADDSCHRRLLVICIKRTRKRTALWIRQATILRVTGSLATG